MDDFDVVVVGSLNQDLVAAVPQLPRPGETVLATGHATHAGGKGANQATAAARLGAAVAMVGRVGDDDAGRSLLAGLAVDDIDTAHVMVDEDAATGLAMINVDGSGENSITVSPGANATVSAADIAAASAVIAAAPVVLLQLEIPLPAIAAAADVARGVVVLNPAPAASLPVALLDRVDVLVPNETELELLAAGLAADVESRAASLPVEEVVVTLGAAGALVATRSGATTVTAPDVVAVDTTGAGDAFCGALAAELARGSYLQAAVRFAVRAAAISVTRHGAQPSMPTRDELT